MRLNRPVLNHQPRNIIKITFIVCDEGQSERKGMGGNEAIKVSPIEWNFRVGISRTAIEWQDFNLCE